MRSNNENYNLHVFNTCAHRLLTISSLLGTLSFALQPFLKVYQLPVALQSLYINQLALCSSIGHSSYAPMCFFPLSCPYCYFFVKCWNFLVSLTSTFLIFFHVYTVDLRERQIQFNSFSRIGRMTDHSNPTYRRC